MRCAVISGTGSYIPTEEVQNSNFLKNEFYTPGGKREEKPTAEIVDKLAEITGIQERRYVTPGLVTSDIVYMAARDCLQSSRYDKNLLDAIIVAHNFGDVRELGTSVDIVPSHAARKKHTEKITDPKVVAYDLIGDEKTLDYVLNSIKGQDDIVVTHDSNEVGCVAETLKQKLGLGESYAVAYDVVFGCPGWLQGIIQAYHLILDEKADSIIATGADTLSRIADPHDKDTMIYSDGAGSALLRAVESDTQVGILSHATRSDANFCNFLRMQGSYNPDYPEDRTFLKMDGNRLFKYAAKTVPSVVTESLEKAEVKFEDVKKILIHQANHKLDYSIVKKLFRLHGKKPSDQEIADIMPMTISWLGNSSVATLPTLLDLISKGKIDNHCTESGDIIVFASVGAGMNINSVVYRMP